MLNNDIGSDDSTFWPFEKICKQCQKIRTCRENKSFMQVLLQECVQLSKSWNNLERIWVALKLKIYETAAKKQYEYDLEV